MNKKYTPTFLSTFGTMTALKMSGKSSREIKNIALIFLLQISTVVMPLIFSQSAKAADLTMDGEISAGQSGTSIQFFWVGRMGVDFYHVRYRVSGGDKQVKISSNSTNGYFFDLNNVKPSATYSIRLQACQSNFLASSNCGPWRSVSFTTAAAPKPYGVDTCNQGYVWREAQPNDRVCVTPAVRTQTRNENNSAADRREPNGGAYGPNTCKQGFVWREATKNDPVCVIPAVRDQAAEDNRQAEARRVP
jgi:hypothetical protein